MPEQVHVTLDREVAKALDRGLFELETQETPGSEDQQLWKKARPIIRAALVEGDEGEGRKAADVEDAYCVEEFLRKVLSWEGSAEDELTEAIESAEKLCAALEPDPATLNTSKGSEQ